MHYTKFCSEAAAQTTTSAAEEVSEADRYALEVHDRREDRVAEEPPPLAVLDEDAEVAVEKSELALERLMALPLRLVRRHRLREPTDLIATVNCHSRFSLS